MKTRVFALFMAMMLVLSLCACGTGTPAATDPVESGSPTPPASLSPEPSEVPEPSYVPVDISVGVLKGPTGIGAALLMEQAATGEAQNNYTFNLAAAPTDLTALVVNGELDICALPTNVAANLYAKTQGEVQLLALNTLGVLYILENGESVTDMASLAGKTIYATGQGSNPEYVLNHILRENGLEPGQDVMVEFMESDVLTAQMAAGEIDLCMLPVPAVTTVLMKNENVRIALDLTEQWDALNSGSTLTMGCLVVRRAFAEENPEAVAVFLKEYTASVDQTLNDPAAAAELVAKHEITGSAQVALAAIPDCNLVCIKGADMRGAIEGYYQVLLSAAPESIGGALPGDDFYYVQK